MNRTTFHTRWIAPGLLATAAILTFAPVAHAGHAWGSWRRYKGVAYGTPRVFVHDHDGGAGPAIAGLIGGFLLGTAVAHPAPVIVHERVYAPPPPEYRYYDPYCDAYFDSFESACAFESRDGRYPRVIEVIASDGTCVRTLHWRDDGWRARGDDDDDRGDY
ncbi:MAG TPA: hypothetical protein VGU27_06845 [Candidatus Eisenbacteria bacterium]|nr:hypothetical protein [Candidatus Eisenbacteria bacterium]